MSIEAMRWAWTQQVKSSHKLVLMAIADGADSFGEARLSQGFLAYQTELTTRSVSSALSALEQAGLVQRLRSSRVNGQRGVDQIVLNLEKPSNKTTWKGLGEVRRQLAERVERDGIAPGEDFGPDLVPERPEDEQDITPGQSHQKNLPVVDREPVDNGEAPSQSHRKNLPVGGPSGKSFRWSPENSSGGDPRGHSPSTRAPVFYPSSSSVGAAAPVDSDDDDETTIDEQQSESQIARIHRGVNLNRLAAECSHATGPWPAPVWAAAVDLILGRAKSRVARPQRYVTGSITNEPAVMLDAASQWAGSDDALAVSLMAENELSQPPVRRVTCPTHHIDHRDDRECGGCRADRLAQRPQEG
ncbi:helix-turn-helix domain-containing protein [Kocuria soli]|uniref:Helix-turn-helix domain-containing protein n=1 Tax=Kocuria soli TaxID=2485125 RepID=A0A3N4AAM2_9MICC|nr:helix-turn-helix domain-containing protein [Kocuria soli]ROZ62775.1 helix-turn-helix domain-containing protein [Kocuria soli]